MFVAVCGWGCSGEKKAALVTLPSTDPTMPTVVGQVEGVAPLSPLYFQLGIAWETDTSGRYSVVKSCSIAPGSVMGATPQNCTVTVPELKLYYSKLNFKVGTLDPVNCPFVSFTPYYYLRSVVNMVNDWEEVSTSVTCSSTKYAKSCFGGAGPAMLEDFGKSFGRYFQSAIGNETNYKLDSSNTVRQLGYWATNLMVTNDIGDPDAGNETTSPAKASWQEKVTAVTAGTARPLETYWQDYTVQCRDLWGASTYSIVIKISDENTESSTTGTIDHFLDWPL